jgi:hypothetical protein
LKLLGRIHMSSQRKVKRDALKEKTRFDLEQEIQSAWNTKEDLELFMRAKFDRVEPMTEDEEANILIGIIHLFNMRMQQVWDTQEFLIKKGALL